MRNTKFKLIYALILTLISVSGFSQRQQSKIDQTWLNEAIIESNSQIKVNQLVYKFFLLYPDIRISVIPTVDTTCFLNITELNLDSEKGLEYIFEIGKSENAVTIMILKKLYNDYVIVFKDFLKFPQIQILTKPNEQKTLMINYQLISNTKTDKSHVIILDNQIHMYKFIRLTKEGYSSIDVPEHVKFNKKDGVTNSEILVPYFSNRDNMLAVTYFYKYKLDPSSEYSFANKFSNDWFYTPYFDGVTTIYINWDFDLGKFYLHEGDAKLVKCFMNPDNKGIFIKTFNSELEAITKYGNQFQKEVCKYIIENK
jgi:hypothetical protein